MRQIDVNTAQEDKYKPSRRDWPIAGENPQSGEYPQAHILHSNYYCILIGHITQINDEYLVQFYSSRSPTDLFLDVGIGSNVHISSIITYCDTTIILCRSSQGAKH